MGANEVGPNRKEVSDEELVEFLLSHGSGHHSKRVAWKIKIWDFTIKSSYVLKRLVDIVGSLTALLLLSP
ncbi:MAG: hypothetical protein RRY34_01085, partial [Victivallaceae bacterium]